MEMASPNEVLVPPSGWITATPLDFYSSLNELSLLDLLHIPLSWPQKHFYIQFCFNLYTPLKRHPDAYLIFHTRDTAKGPCSPQDLCYTLGNINRWRLDIAPYANMNQFLDGMKRWHRCNYCKSEKTFSSYGCETTYHEGDWSEHAEAAYRLYANVAQKHGDWLYDLHFFKMIAQRPDYKLLCGWYQGKMIGMFVLQEELPTLHSICLGLDYIHTSASYAYSWMHYDLIARAIEMQKYQNIDIGLTADESKKTIGFSPVESNMDIYTNRVVTGGILRAISRYVTTTITPGAKLKFQWR